MILMLDIYFFLTFSSARHELETWDSWIWIPSQVSTVLIRRNINSKGNIV